VTATAVFETTTPRWQAAARQASDYERQFELQRLPCPVYCDRSCAENHNGDSIQHFQEMALVEAICEDQTGSHVAVRAWRSEQLNALPSDQVDIDFLDSGDRPTAWVTLSPAQARQLADELNRSADFAQPEFELPAERLRVGDLYQVGREWLYVYGVMVDEPSNNVQIFTTVDRATWPELDGDEDPHMFEPGDLVRIRRGGAR
jgi:hypothetical protein